MKKQNNLNPQTNIFIIDAKDQSLGRLASQIAYLLSNKNNPSFAPNVAGNNIIKIKNIKEVKITGKKLTSKSFFSHSGYPGHLKEMSLGTLFKKNPEEVLKKAVYGMLPKNKLQDRRIKRLLFIKE